MTIALAGHLGGARSRTIIATLALGAIALASVAHAEPAPQARTVAEVTAAADAIVAAFGRHDAKAYFARFAPEATFVFHTTPRRLESRAEYEAEWAKWEKEDGFHVRGCRSSNQRVQLLGDVAVFSHSVRTELTMNSGPSTVRERETIVFQRRAGGWIAVHEHLSPDPSAQAPAAK
ncbi:MAG: nuclear transport factor 2 family protein [Deltaproteobacteria bacterium]|nr:nuclear transport factor 2 family protein [Deltaproteobacteria bacterium]